MRVVGILVLVAVPVVEAFPSPEDPQLPPMSFAALLLVGAALLAPATWWARRPALAIVSGLGIGLLAAWELSTFGFPRVPSLLAVIKAVIVVWIAPAAVALGADRALGA